MTCEKPILIKLSYGKEVVNPITGEKSRGLLVPCGKCVLCKIAKTREWALRCQLELPYWEDSIFTTLTYDDDHLPDNCSLVKKDLQDFLKRLRFDIQKPIKYFACGEYGDKGRCHFHLIIFGIGYGDFNYELDCHYSENHCIERAWQKGNVFNGSVTYDSMKYVCGYIFKKYGSKLNQKLYKDAGLEIPFQLQSKGIGKEFFNDYKDLIFERGYILYQGEKHSLPRYYVNMMKSQDLERYKKLVDSGLIHEFEEFMDKRMRYYRDLLGYQPTDFDSKLLWHDLCFEKEKEEFFQNMARGHKETHRMEIRK